METNQQPTNKQEATEPVMACMDMTPGVDSMNDEATGVIELYERLMAVTRLQGDKLDALAKLAASTILARSLCASVLSAYEKVQPKSTENDPESVEAVHAWMEGYEDIRHIRSSLDWAMNYCTRQMNFRLMVLENEQERQEIMECVQQRQEQSAKNQQQPQSQQDQPPGSI